MTLSFLVVLMRGTALLMVRCLLSRESTVWEDLLILANEGNSVPVRPPRVTHEMG